METIVRVSTSEMPQTTSEMKMGEETKVAVRNHRREAMDIIKKMKTAKELSEDEAAGCEADVEKLISTYKG